MTGKIDSATKTVLDGLPGALTAQPEPAPVVVEDLHAQMAEAMKARDEAQAELSAAEAKFRTAAAKVSEIQEALDSQVAKGKTLQVELARYQEAQRKRREALAAEIAEHGPSVLDHAMRSRRRQSPGGVVKVA